MKFINLTGRIAISGLFYLKTWVPQEAFQDPEHVMFPCLYWTELIVVAYFTFDFLLRAFSWPSIIAFVKSPQNIVDLLSLVPFYAQICFSGVVFIESGKILRIFRIFRVIKLFK